MAWLRLASGRAYPKREAIITHGAALTTERNGRKLAIELEEQDGRHRVWRVELTEAEAESVGLTIAPRSPDQQGQHQEPGEGDGCG